jgi:MFS family permease
LGQTPDTAPLAEATAPRDPSGPLSPSETARALRAFMVTNALWGAWVRMVGIGTAVFTGYALWLGATESEIAYFFSIVSFASLAQLASTVTVGRARRRKPTILLLGTLEGLLRSSIVLIPLVFQESGRVLSMAILLGLSLICGHVLSPLYNEWLATTIPEDIRGRYTGRYTIAQLVAGIVAAYVVGWYLDLFSEADRYTGFFTVFASAIVLVVWGYANLMRVPLRTPAPELSLGNLLAPLRDRRFRKLLIFFLSWHFALGIAAPFYSVFMLKTLQISYTTVAMFHNLFMAAMIVGYKVWGSLVDRYGSKAVLQIMIAPTALVPVLWVFNRPDLYVLIPVAMVLNGLLHSGIMVAVNPLLYSILPDRQSKTAYFASWSCASLSAFALAPLLGGALVRHFEPIGFELLGVPVGNLQLVFLVSAGTLLLPNLFLRTVQDAKQTTPGQLLSQVARGNLLSYMYGSFTYDVTRDESGRARAARRMGRSRSPMALDRLIRALEDASPEVRRQAARGLGEARSREALNHLVDELRDEESDIRSEAAEALGKIGDPEVIDPLIDALDAPDVRIQISAIRALSEIGGEEADELLFWKFAEGFDRATFPTLADTLGRARDYRMVVPTLLRLDSFRSPAIRLQLLNAVCRVLGARRRFYQLVSRDSLSRASRLEEMLGQLQRAFGRTRFLESHVRTGAAADLRSIRQAFENGDHGRFAESVRELIDGLETRIGGETVEALGEETASRIGAVILAVKTFLGIDGWEGAEDISQVFLITCLWCLGDALESAR